MEKRAEKPHKTREQARFEVAEMMAQGLLSPTDLQELTNAQMRTEATLSQALEEGVMENQNEHAVPYSEAVIFLREAGFDLENARVEAVKLHEQWGLVRALQQKGIIKNVDQYGALFDNSVFTQKGIAKLIEKMKDGENWMPLFNPGHLNPRELWNVLFKEGGIPYFNDSYGFQHLDELREVAPSDIPDLNSAQEKSYQEQIKDFKTAYEKSRGIEDCTCVSFTPDELEVKNVNKSATHYAKAALEGAQFIDPNADWIRWRTQYALTGQRPDSHRTTQYPLHVFKNGGVGVLFWCPVIGRLSLRCCYPGALDGIGPRFALR